MVYDCIWVQILPLITLSIPSHDPDTIIMQFDSLPGMMDSSMYSMDNMETFSLLRCKNLRHWPMSQEILTTKSFYWHRYLAKYDIDLTSFFSKEWDIAIRFRSLNFTSYIIEWDMYFLLHEQVLKTITIDKSRGQFWPNLGLWVIPNHSQNWPRDLLIRLTISRVGDPEKEASQMEAQ